MNYASGGTEQVETRFKTKLILVDFVKDSRLQTQILPFLLRVMVTL